MRIYPNVKCIICNVENCMCCKISSDVREKNIKRQCHTHWLTTTVLISLFIKLGLMKQFALAPNKKWLPF